MRIHSFVPVLALSASMIAACEKPAAPAPSAAPPAASAAAPVVAPPAALTVAPPSAAALPPAAAGGLTWSASEPLVRGVPRSSMRAAQYSVAGDNTAELSVFYFGPDAGGIEPNLTRWIGQFVQPDGSDTQKTVKRSERTVNGLSAIVIEATGTYGGGMGMPGTPAPGPQLDAMLLGAIVSGPQGPVFFKLVGARETLVRAREAFDQLLASLHPAS